ncbi:MAG: hypothetical protein ACRD08_14655 [Acidimicrobiales bacterium]
MWVLTVVLVGALLITLTAIVVDSPLGRSIARRFEPDGVGPGGDVKQLQQTVELLEGEVEELSRTLAGLRDEVQFVHRLLEDPTRKKRPPA